MKKILLLILFISAIANAQIVNIPDANFKAKLLTNPGLDANGDGNIQQSEALAQFSLSLSNANITDLTGIESFTNVVSLDCHSNSLTSLNISSLNQLINLDCSHNELTSLVLPTSSPLQELRCIYNALSSLNLSAFSQLNYLQCSNNSLTSLILPPTATFTDLRCNNNQLTSLNLSGIIAFDLYCNNNQLTSLNTVGATIANLDCSFNQLSYLNLAGINILSINCINNLLTTLDLSGCFTINSIDCYYNPLITIYAKNGRNESIVAASYPTLEYICADETQISTLQSQFQLGAPNVVINSYCSFIPGGSYNTISGSVTFDSDNNGCTAGDPANPLIRVNCNSTTIQSATYTNTNGIYNFYPQAGTYTVTPIVENSAYFNFSPPSVTIPFANNNSNTVIQNFCMSANGTHNDVEVVIVPTTSARPGFDAVYKVVYKNKGNQMLSGSINFTFEDDVLDYVSASIEPNSQSFGNLNWNYTNLLPFESRHFTVTLNVNSPTETPPVNIGDQLDFSVTINPVLGDETPIDNVFGLKQTVIGSLDPNDKTCLEGTVVSPIKIGDYLHYNINFENTGTAAATFIVIKDIIDTAKFDINSLQIMNSSHPMTTRITGDKVEFIFQNINLGAGQHGNVVFKIKTKNTLVTGNTVTNKADIYFDYNFPVITNLASTTFQALSNSGFELDDSIVVYPNPATSLINIQSNSTIKSTQLFDVQGRLLQTSIENTSNTIIDISEKSNGVYFLKITSNNGSKVEKIVKE